MYERTNCSRLDFVDPAREKRSFGKILDVILDVILARNVCHVEPQHGVGSWHTDDPLQVTTISEDRIDSAHIVVLPQ